MTDTTALENLKYAHACDVALDLSSQEVHELWADIEAKEKRVAELEAAQRWIPVSERLPETPIMYDQFDTIVEFESITGGIGRMVQLLSWNFRTESWYEDLGEFGFEDVTRAVTHWRERPKLPEVQP